MAAIIEVEQVAKSFGEVHALEGMDLSVPEGQVVGLLGPNGAGKTTLVRILATLLRADTGSARVAGFDVAREPMRVRRVVGLAGQASALDDALTGRENLEMIGRLSRLSPTHARQRAGDVLDRLRLADAGDRLVRTYSGGMKRRLDLGAALVSSPPVLVLDEPTTGLDPRARIDLWDYLRDLIGEGRSLLLTTQYLEEADQMADEIVVIDHGRVIAGGTPSELKARVGGEVVELTVEDAVDLERAAAVLAPVGADAPHTEAETATITLTVHGGASSLIDAAKRLDDSGIRVADLGLRRPSLDDVFLALTGRPAEEVQADDDAVAVVEEGAPR
jgi:ABC-2 type transport system ATP-binding protein